MKNKTAAVLLSGGMDSAVVLAEAIRRHGQEEVLAISYSYGQKHDSEIEHAKAITEYYEHVEHIILTVDNQIFAGSDSSLLKASDKAIKKGTYSDEINESADGIVETYVPFRNGLMLSQAAAIAFSRGATWVMYGAHADDSAGEAYPDCSPDFYHAIRKAIELGTAGKVTMDAPLINLSKAGVVEMGLDLLSPLHLTRSCYNSGEVSCGECATCVDRLNAFTSNGLRDSITYIKNNTSKHTTYEAALRQAQLDKLGENNQ